jgi:DNA polymerase epsilon subunit 1
MLTNDLCITLPCIVRSSSCSLLWLTLVFIYDFQFVHKETQKVFKMSYPCAMLNVMVANNNTNDQFATLVDAESKKYETSSEMTIEFEVDGPYLAMVLPASKEEGKLIKKRYAVFNFDGSLAELKGFELKRRGELKLIKVFQSEVFDQFLLGNDLSSCYDAVAAVANRWLDMLDTKGADLTDQELVEHISESSVMSKGLDEYDNRKSCAITCARRLAEFLGDGRVRDKGLVCNYVVSAFPTGTPTSERAIPVAIFSTDPSVAKTYLRKWCGGGVGSSDSEVPDVRDIVDWAYYRERLGSAIQKIITIPAAMQQVKNPVPRIRHPDWLHKMVSERNDKKKQISMSRFLTAEENHTMNVGRVSDVDMEDAFNQQLVSPVTEKDPGPPVAEEIPDPVSPQTPLVRVEGFTRWLESRKNSWRKSRIERRKRMDTHKINGTQPKDVRAGLESLFAKQSDALTSRPWQVVSLSTTDRPGVFKTWVVIDGKMNGINVSVPRMFYVSTSLPQDDSLISGLGGQLVTKQPTDCDTVNYVYQFCLSEEVYLQHFTDIQARLTSSPHIFNVYEAQIPLEWTLSVKLGCVATVLPAAQGKNIGTGVHINDLTSQTLTREGYFSHGDGLKHALLYHSEDATTGRALIAMHVPADRKCHLWIINPARGGQKEINATVLTKSWDDTVASCISELEDVANENNFDPEEPGFEISYFKRKDIAIKLIRKALRSFR